MTETPQRVRNKNSTQPATPSPSTGLTSPPQSSMVSRTIRLDRSVDEMLEKTASDQGTSVNSLVNRIIQRYVEWDSLNDRFGAMYIQPQVFEKLINLGTDEELRELGRWAGANLNRDFMQFWFKSVDYTTLLKAFELPAKYARGYRYEFYGDGHNYTLVMNHSMGHKASIFYEAWTKATFQEIFKKDVEVETTENQIVARFTLDPREVAPKAVQQTRSRAPR